MMEQNSHLDSLKDIKDLMEKSSKFISLSGLSGISAGVFALFGAYLAYGKLSDYYNTWGSRVVRYMNADTNSTQVLIPLNADQELTYDLVLIGIGTLVAALISSTFFTARRTKQKKQSLWNPTSIRLLINTSIPLVTGGLFSLILLKNNLFGLIAPTTLIFYGLALLNGSKFTLPEIRYVGIINIFLGLLNGLFIGYGLIFWSLGFGVINIIYGIYMYLKYERNN